MAINDYLQLLRKRWLIVVLCTCVGLGGAIALVAHATTKYQASAQLFVAAKDSGDLSTLAQGGQFTQARVQSYADIIGSPRVTGPVAELLHDGLTAQQISDRVSASAPLNTVLVNVQVTDTSAARAQAIANAVSSEFASYAAALERTTGNSASPVKVTVVKPAALPTSPISPRSTLDIVFGLLVGLIAGLAGAVVRDALDNTVKTALDVQAVAGSGALGVIAFDPDAKSQPLVVAHGAHSTRSEAFRQLRTNLQFVDVDDPPRSIVFTSSVPDEGKTTTVCNLAITLAQSGVRVLLVEADLRRPRASKYLDLTSAVGLTNVLVGAVGVDDVTQQWGDLPLYVLPAGPTPPNPSELLASRGMRELLSQLEKKYDLVLFDTPPLLPVTDAAVLASQSGGAVVVVRHGKTHRQQLERSVEALASVNARLLGCVLNMTPKRGPDAYHYGYAYTYKSESRHRADTAATHTAATPLPEIEPLQAPPTTSTAPSTRAAGTTTRRRASQPRTRRATPAKPVEASPSSE